MKNSYIKLAVLGMAALVVSCRVNETFDDSYVPEKGDIVFRLATQDTRSMDADNSSIQGATIDLETEDGTSFFFEETITRLDGQARGSETRGTPAFTENVGKLYSDLGMYAAGNFGSIIFNRLDDEMFEGGWRYRHRFENSPWPTDKDEPVGFYLHMPATMSVKEGNNTVGVTTDLTVAAPYATTGKITFNYTSPTSIQNMKDIGFAYRTMSENDYVAYGKKGAPFLFNHALTGVKFAIGNTDTDIADNSIAITEVIFKGLYDTGVCTISPVSESNYRDDTSNHSSSSNGVVVWNSPSASAVSTGDGYSSGTFSTTLQNYGKSSTDVEGNTVSGHFTNNGNYPDSFAAAGASKNLNDGDATQTFWFIPQSLSRRSPSGEEGSDDYDAGETPVTLTVKYTYKGKAGEWVIDFGTILSQIEWKAGELRTYTLRIANVNVKIEDDVVMSDNYDSDDFTTAVDSYKENVTITNTGNTPAYIRAAIVGQWLDESGKPVFAFTEFKEGGIEIKEVPSWYDDQFGSAPSYEFGYFTKLDGYKGPEASAVYSAEKWKKGSDGYYYYSDPVPVGEATAEALFEKYTVTYVPEVRVGGIAQKVTFELEIATQAISANKTDGTQWSSYTAAWDNAKAQ